MTDLIVIVPSRGRPAAAGELADAFAATCSADTRLVFAVDNDDPTRDAYSGFDPAVGKHMTAGGSMVQALNATATAVVDVLVPFAVGFMGDDHRPRTKGWDEQYLEALHELGTGLVYGDDLLQRHRLPTQVAMTSDIVRELGFMAPPQLQHMYVDNFWLELGRRAGCIRYLSGVVVEHLHPVAGKAAWDAGYQRVNDPGVYYRDSAMLDAFEQAGGFREAVAKVRALRGAVA